MSDQTDRHKARHEKVLLHTVNALRKWKRMCKTLSITDKKVVNHIIKEMKTIPPKEKE